MIQFGKLYVTTATCWTEYPNGDEVEVLNQNTIIIPIGEFNYIDPEDNEKYRVIKLLYLDKILHYYFSLNPEFKKHQKKFEERVKLYEL